ncbi:hypothetical protein [Bradyrhizobium sp. 33ap4]|uniref:hypothetical protein n=1 Tax=Bradyrhizobium sp. 33ap4 TaxID=3061630 RepID=UPI00292E5169|nr:hypothetical protein [Bradyrhizobium sp. 33ap4]
MEAETKRNTGVIQDAQRWNDSKRHVGASGFRHNECECDARRLSQRVSNAGARGDHSMMLHPVDVIARQGAHERGEPSSPRKGFAFARG